MNIIKKVVVFVMGIVVIGIVSTAVGVTTQSKTVEKNVTFEVLTETTINNGTFNSLIVLDTVDIDKITLEVNDNIVDITSIKYDSNNNAIVITSNEGDPFYIYSDDTYFDDGIDFSIGTFITITFDVEIKTPAIIKTLLVLIPLVLTASVIGYIAVKKGDE